MINANRQLITKHNMLGCSINGAAIVQPKSLMEIVNNFHRNHSTNLIGKNKEHG